MLKHPDVMVLLPVYKQQHRYYWLALQEILRQVSAEDGYATASSCYIDQTRNELAAEFLKSDKEWSLWIDDDTMVPPEAIDKFKERGKSFVSGLYLKKVPPYFPCAWMNHEPTGMISYLTHWKRNELREVDGVGFGCAFIHRSVYEDIQKTHVIRLWTERNWPILKIREAGEEDERIPSRFKYPFFFHQEDIWFCDRAKEAGHKIYLDCSVECIHLDDVHLLDVTRMMETMRGAGWRITQRG